MNILFQKLENWDDEQSRETMLRLEHLEKRLYYSYEPTLPPEPDFFKRLPYWLNNVGGNEEDEKLMFNLLPKIFYVGPEEFTELYRVAYNGPIARWLIEELGIQLDDNDAMEKLFAAVEETWFCPITDSMKISDFYHRNKISAAWNYRPDWSSLSRFGNEEKIQKYCNGKIKRLVLLEDFVGSGSQMRNAIEYAFKFRDLFSILVVPLLVCPKGFEQGVELEDEFGITFKPVLKINSENMISEKFNDDHTGSAAKIFNLAKRTFEQISEEPFNPKRKPYHPLGWKKTGAMVVMYTNVPNNSLPLLHWQSQEWFPIFPRHDRV